MHIGTSPFYTHLDPAMLSVLHVHVCSSRLEPCGPLPRTVETFDAAILAELRTTHPPDDSPPPHAHDSPPARTHHRSSSASGEGGQEGSARTQLEPEHVPKQAMELARQCGLEDARETIYMQAGKCMFVLPCSGSYLLLYVILCSCIVLRQIPNAASSFGMIHIGLRRGEGMARTVRMCD